MNTICLTRAMFRVLKHSGGRPGRWHMRDFERRYPVARMLSWRIGRRRSRDTEHSALKKERGELSASGGDRGGGQLIGGLGGWIVGVDDSVVLDGRSRFRILAAARERGLPRTGTLLPGRLLGRFVVSFKRQGCHDWMGALHCRGRT
eukprot:307346-Amorphochlora_amoeboformis.AAC.1